MQLTGERNRVHNRIHKVLEDATLKLDTVLSAHTAALVSVPSGQLIANTTTNKWPFSKDGLRAQP